MSTTFVMKGEPYAPPRRKPGKRCEKKRPYDTERDAMLAAQKLAGRKVTDKTKAMRIYRCKICGKIHLTSDSQINFSGGAEFEKGYGYDDIRFIVQQDWFAEWISGRMLSSDDPTLEAVILSELLQKMVPGLSDMLSPEAIATFTPARFIPNWQNLHAVPYGFSMQMDEAQ